MVHYADIRIARTDMLLGNSKLVVAGGKINILRRKSFLLEKFWIPNVNRTVQYRN